MCAVLSRSTPLRDLIELPAEIATAFFFAASIGVGAGAVAASHTHRLAPTFQVALAAFLVAAASFTYAIWRSRRLRSRRMFRRMRTVVARR
jgi:membrane protein implicated in regulation of membrane protease activity